MAVRRRGGREILVEDVDDALEGVVPRQDLLLLRRGLYQGGAVGDPPGGEQEEDPPRNRPREQHLGTTFSKILQGASSNSRERKETLSFLQKLILQKLILQIFGGLVLGCIKTKFCKTICV